MRPLLELATGRLRAAGGETARLDAELLLAHALGTERAQLISDPGRPVDPPAARRFEAMVARRAAHEPVAYILGWRGFRHIELAVDGRVLVPRPETELLVEAALGLPPGARLVDVGTGSGAVALALKNERPDLEVMASDVSAPALEVARANARRLGLDVAFRQADLLDGVPGPLDAVVANLPYVAAAELDRLPPDVADHEPRLALAGGDDGLEVMRRLVEQATGVAFLALEVGLGQADRVRELLARSGRASTRVMRDLAAIERVVVGATA